MVDDSGSFDLAEYFGQSSKDPFGSKGIGEDDYEWAISTIDAMAPESNSSLFRDIQSNRPSELHSIHGFLVREAERLSVDVPALRFIYHCLIPQENLARES